MATEQVRVFLTMSMQNQDFLQLLKKKVIMSPIQIRILL